MFADDDKSMALRPVDGNIASLKLDGARHRQLKAWVALNLPGQGQPYVARAWPLDGSPVLASTNALPPVRHWTAVNATDPGFDFESLRCIG